MTRLTDFFILILVVITIITLLWGRFQGAVAIVLGVVGGSLLYFIGIMAIMKIYDLIQRITHRQ